MEPTRNSRTELTESQWAMLEPLIDEFAQNLCGGGQANIDDVVARVDSSLQDNLRQELVGEEFAHRFGDATQGGKLRYRVIAQLGKGAFGEVYKAVDEQLNRPVAIKVLLRTVEATKQRFLTEARRQANLESHANLIAMFDAGELPSGNPFLVMELIDGCSLRQKLDSEGTLTPELAARLLEQIALAVAAVHKGTKGSKSHPTTPLVHRDLKPENILLDGNDQAFVADFGLAAAVIDLHDGTACVGGTIPYMSPEQATAFRTAITPASIDTRSDVWALGVILYELVTGKQPFVSQAADSQARRDDILEAILR